MNDRVDSPVAAASAVVGAALVSSVLVSVSVFASTYERIALRNETPAFVCAHASEPSSPDDGNGARPTVCEPGEVPDPVARFDVKGIPHLEPSSHPKDGGNPGYYYAETFQTVTATSAAADLTQHAPTVAADEGHSLAELALISADGGDIVEIGWIVFAGLPQPQLFVFHWVDGNPTCYNACGYVQLSATRYPGMNLDADEMPHNYSIAHQGDRWYLGYDGEWIGYFPDEIWNGAFVETGVIEWFGEVASGNERPCSQMGAGVFGDAPNAARISAESVDGLPAEAALGDDQRPGWYSIGDFSPDAFSYGGPGDCNDTAKFNRIRRRYEPVRWPAE